MHIAQETFRQFTDDLRLILKDNLFEIIIHGSYVLNDFKDNLGDLDFLVLSNGTWDELVTRSLLKLHERYRSEKQLLLHQLEGTYYPKSFMKYPEDTLLGLYIGTSSMKSVTSRQTSYMDLRLINLHGLMLLESNCSTYNPSESELFAEQKSDLQAFRTAIADKSSIDFGLWISLIHWTARTLFYRANGSIGSKTEACQWCSEQPDLMGFWKLFNFAMSLRYPYQNGRIPKPMQTACLDLLNLVGI